MERIKYTNTKKINLDKLNRNLIVLIVVLGVAYFILQIFVTSIVGTKSEEIDKVRNQKTELRLENEIISSKIDKSKSIDSTKDIVSKLNLTSKNVNFLQEADLNNVALSK